MEIENAIEFIKEKHKEQKRIQGTPYYIHPLEVSILLKNKENIYKNSFTNEEVLNIRQIFLEEKADYITASTIMMVLQKQFQNLFLMNNLGK